MAVLLKKAILRIREQEESVLKIIKILKVDGRKEMMVPFGLSLTLQYDDKNLDSKTVLKFTYSRVN